MEREIMKMYISGPMTGIPNLNFPLFHSEAEKLRAAGFQVINPAELNPDPSKSWTDCMRVDIKALMECDGIHMLPGWTASRGAVLEHHIAVGLGMCVTTAPNLSTYQESKKK